MALLGGMGTPDILEDVVVDLLFEVLLGRVDVAQQLARAVDLLGVHAGLGVVEVLSRAQRHDDLFKARVARALADAVDRAFDLRRARADAFERIRDRHAEVVVAVDGDVDVLDALDVFTQVGDEVIHLLRRGVADGVGHIQRRRARGDGSGVAMGQKTRCHRNSSWRRRPSRGCGR